MPETISCEPNDLIQAAACFRCIPNGEQEEVIIYLLNEILGTGLTPQQLMDATNPPNNHCACMRTIPKGMRDEVITYLLCQIANAA